MPAPLPFCRFALRHRHHRCRTTAVSGLHFSTLPTFYHCTGFGSCTRTGHRFTACWTFHPASPLPYHHYCSSVSSTVYYLPNRFYLSLFCCCLQFYFHHLHHGTGHCRRHIFCCSLCYLPACRSVGFGFHLLPCATPWFGVRCYTLPPSTHIPVRFGWFTTHHHILVRFILCLVLPFLPPPFSFGTHVSGFPVLPGLPYRFYPFFLLPNTTTPAPASF